MENTIAILICVIGGLSNSLQIEFTGRSNRYPIQELEEKLKAKI